MYDDFFSLLSILGIGGLVAFIVIWGVSFVTARDAAQSKGLNPDLWASISFFIGPLALICLMAYARDEDTINRRKLKSGRNLLCPFCRGCIDSRSVCCGNCRNILKPQAYIRTIEHVTEREKNEIEQKRMEEEKRRLRKEKVKDFWRSLFR